MNWQRHLVIANTSNSSCIIDRYSDVTLPCWQIWLGTCQLDFVWGVIAGLEQL
jgi:hypothetical protein